MSAGSIKIGARAGAPRAPRRAPRRTQSGGTAESGADAVVSRFSNTPVPAAERQLAAATPDTGAPAGGHRPRNPRPGRQGQGERRSRRKTRGRRCSKPVSSSLRYCRRPRMGAPPRRRHRAQCHHGSRKMRGRGASTSGCPCRTRERCKHSRGLSRGSSKALRDEPGCEAAGESPLAWSDGHWTFARSPRLPQPVREAQDDLLEHIDQHVVVEGAVKLRFLGQRSLRSLVEHDRGGVPVHR